MVGNGCVAIACDKRLGLNGQHTISSNFPKAFKITDSTYFAACGLATDVQTLKGEIEFKANMYELNCMKKMEVKTLAHMVGSLLYSRRFGPWFVSSIIAGLDKHNAPKLYCFDLIGAPCNADDFVVVGTCSEQLYGICESLYRPNMDPPELFETISQCLMAAIDRDCLSGWGAEVHLITPEKITVSTLKTRMD
ncbi:proteasome A-type and B-type family protein, putative [Babesia bigemina]|uniref:Proteasome A-type and B-type family protein, putative n=1 Tax=Babesia bigemina TaxID=5866 RepID=A0A061DA33_BABBI|nr:proteasome A-type and B-type family protein, putative [Babesia bigemina]CDR96797.1 proteasome A-type and B-type family protein, putative [Babesia bigemina]|eukprot:XP_012768983.1 proteasome A-type and B-type family protein, putative [Babesia bigemina]